VRQPCHIEQSLIVRRNRNCLQGSNETGQLLFYIRLNQWERFLISTPETGHQVSYHAAFYWRARSLFVGTSHRWHFSWKG